MKQIQKTAVLIFLVFFITSFQGKPVNKTSADNKVGLEVLNYFLDNFVEDLYTVVTVEENQIYKQSKLTGIQTEVFDKNIHNEFYNKSLELGILAWWPQIIKEPLLSLPQNGFINFHPSFLPYNRGKLYNFWALVEQCPFGVSLHKVDSGVDTGEIVSQRQISYNWEDNGETLTIRRKLK